MEIVKTTIGSFIPISAILEIYQNDNGYFIRIIGENKYRIEESTFKKLTKGVS
jgi:hypothetical protein